MNQNRIVTSHDGMVKVYCRPEKDGLMLPSDVNTSRFTPANRSASMGVKVRHTTSPAFAEVISLFSASL